ncbi:cobalamin B12-binding domain-containing protein [Streptomyces sp. NPDC098077]|uniref:cobalamin B12-binding domain-containing protein n=1 Tax=Streptomyces sp. NPDC098077 TaxID=3366093 RepID=UPI003826E32F
MLNVIISGTRSDSHTWNLIYLQRLLEEQGNQVRNIGPCVPVPLLLRECLSQPADLLVLSSVNGHGFDDGLATAPVLRREVGGLRMVIGGKLTTGQCSASVRDRLLDSGFDEAFPDGDIGAFLEFLDRVSVGIPVP